MKDVLTITRQLWLEAQLSAPPLIQDRIISPLLTRKETFRLLLKPFVKIQQLQGQNQSGPLTITYVGLETAAMTFFRKYFFAEDPIKTQTGRVSLWRIPKITTLPDSDLLIIVAGKQIINKLSRQKAVVMPSRIVLQLDTQGTWDDIRRRFRKNVRSKLRLTRKYGYTYRISHSSQDFEHFYHQMYLPTMEERHGILNSPVSKWQAYVYFKHGYLLLIERDGQCVAGGLSYSHQKMLFFVLLGVLNADTRLIKEGTLGALHILLFQWANQKGFETIDFMGAEPCLQSGLFKYKRQWGSRAIIPYDEDSRIWLKIQRNNPAVLRCLKDNPLVVIDQKGALQGLIITDDPANVDNKLKLEWQKQYATPGLENLLVYSITDLMNDSVSLQSAWPVSEVQPSQ